MSVHRHGHEDFSLFLAEPKLRELLDGIYEEPDRTVIVSEVLQGIISHRADGEPLTLEAGILRVADALDMEQGRSRIPFERGHVGIHSLSAAAIEDVSIGDGDEKPIRIEITMNNSSGIYQIDALLRRRSCAAPASSPTSRSSPTSTPRPRSASSRSTGSRSEPRSSLARARRYTSEAALRDRLMVGRLTLDQVVKVRVLVPQPSRKPCKCGAFGKRSGVKGPRSRWRTFLCGAGRG